MIFITFRLTWLIADHRTISPFFTKIYKVYETEIRRNHHDQSPMQKKTVTENSKTNRDRLINLSVNVMARCNITQKPEDKIQNRPPNQCHTYNSVKAILLQFSDLATLASCNPIAYNLCWTSFCANWANLSCGTPSTHLFNPLITSLELAELINSSRLALSNCLLKKIDGSCKSL